MKSYFHISNKILRDICRTNDHTGKYSLIIGIPVTTLDNIPDAILKTWSEIWQDTQLNRVYRADVTLHVQKYYDGDNAEVETYISIID